MNIIFQNKIDFYFHLYFISEPSEKFIDFAILGELFFCHHFFG